MKIIFGTTNKRKQMDLQKLSHSLNLDFEILNMDDIGWNKGEIEENGQTIEENAFIKAKALYDFCHEKCLNYPIITDDTGLFCETLNGDPGLYTARYADDEMLDNKDVPPHQCVIKLLRNLKEKENRRACYRCCVTCILPDGSHFQEFGESNGVIAKDIVGELKKPYFYTIFIIDEYQKAFSDLTDEELMNTFRYQTLKKVLLKLTK